MKTLPIRLIRLIDNTPFGQGCTLLLGAVDAVRGRMGKTVEPGR